MIYIGETKFTGGYIGEKKISKIYVNENIVYQNKITSGLYETGHAGDPAYLKMSWDELKFTYPSAFTNGGTTIVGRTSGSGTYQSYFVDLSGEFVIDLSITNISRRAFEQCVNLTNISIPNSVTNIDMNAFYYCEGIVNITIPNSVTSIGYSAFNNCRELTNIIIPDSVIYIDEYAFLNCIKIANAIIGNGVRNISNSMFYYCPELVSVTIPSSVINIGRYAFSGCGKLVDINYLGTKSQWNAITKDSGWNRDTGNYIIHCTDGDIPKS